MTKPTPLRQECRMPGWWFIEGFSVHREKGIGGYAWWQIWDAGRMLAEVGSLSAARAWIRGRLSDA